MYFVAGMLSYVWWKVGGGAHGAIAQVVQSDVWLLSRYEMTVFARTETRLGRQFALQILMTKAKVQKSVNETDTSFRLVVAFRQSNRGNFFRKITFPCDSCRCCAPV